MAANTIFPQLSKKNKIEAFLMVQCMVDEQLKLTPVEVVNDVDGVFTNEAIRVLNMVPALDEGARKAGLVGSKLYVTIAFVFGGEEALFNTRSARADSAALYTDIGIDLINKGLYTDAVGKLDIALKYMTTDSRAFYNRAMAKLKLNNSIAACDDFKRAILLGYQQAVDYVKIYCK
jgi:tetratricopeptide (TPR) repeat protein